MSKETLVIASVSVSVSVSGWSQKALHDHPKCLDSGNSGLDDH